MLLLHLGLAKKLLAQNRVRQENLLSSMQITNYLIEQAHTDWNLAFQPWSWLLPERFSLWLVNRFCDCFLIKEDGSVWMLDVGIGTLETVAQSRQHFADLADYDETGDKINDWFLTDLIDQLVATELHLQPGQCYSFKILPVLGGEYAVDNVYVNSIEKHLAAAADMHHQLKDVPNGTPFRLKIT